MPKDLVYSQDAWGAARSASVEPAQAEQYRSHTPEGTWTGTDPTWGKGKGSAAPAQSEQWGGYQPFTNTAPTFGADKGFGKGMQKGKGKDDSVYRAFGEVPVASLGPGGLRGVQADKMREEIDFGKMMRNAVAAERAHGDPRVGGVQYVPRATENYAFDVEGA